MIIKKNAIVRLKDIPEVDEQYTDSEHLKTLEFIPMVCSDGSLLAFPSVDIQVFVEVENSKTQLPSERKLYTLAINHMELAKTGPGRPIARRSRQGQGQ